MLTYLSFRTAAGRFGVPIDATVAVRSADELRPLPSSRPGVVGLLPGDDPVTVSTLLGEGDRQVVVLAAGDRRFGVLVEEVTGLRRVEPSAIGPAPSGQGAELVAGIVHADDGMVLLADPEALAAELDR